MPVMKVNELHSCGRSCVARRVAHRWGPTRAVTASMSISGVDSLMVHLGAMPAGAVTQAAGSGCGGRGPCYVFLGKPGKCPLPLSTWRLAPDGSRRAEACAAWQQFSPYC